MKIRRWIRDGHEGLSDVKNTDELMNRAGLALDHACSHDIMGTVVFEGEDGKVYVGTVEFTIGEINPKYLMQLDQEDAESEGTNDEE